MLFGLTRCFSLNADDDSFLLGDGDFFYRIEGFFLLTNFIVDRIGCYGICLDSLRGWERPEIVLSLILFMSCDFLSKV
jgi:hypothetical protein